MGHLADVVCLEGGAGIAVAPSRKLRFTDHHTFRSVPMRSTRAAWIAMTVLRIVIAIQLIAGA
jgi:hypothetical protein